MHILKSLLDYQSNYWFSGKKSDLQPLTLSQFLFLYPLPYLDQSRLSRLIPNLPVLNPQSQVINLRNLFISKKKYHSYIIKEIVSNNETALKDKEIQRRLAQREIRLSVRTICNCRKLLNIHNWKEKASYYEKGTTFGNQMVLMKKNLSKIPNASGAYELSIPSKIDYPGYKSRVVYLGSSKNLRKRLAGYTGSNLKNQRLSKFSSNYNLSLRFCLTEDYISTEKKLLRNFKNIHGELPRANSLGG